MSNHFKIIIPFYNVEQWIKICIRSVKAQDYNDYECILIDDISTDKSADIVKKEIGDDKRFRLVSNKNKAYALKNIYDAIELSNPDQEDIIVTLDGDDWLANKGVLKTLNDKYTKSNCWLTYGSYAEYPGGRRGKFSKQLPTTVINDGSYREVEWCTSHMRTFKYHLWSKIEKEDLLDEEGNFFRMTWDLAFMFPMLEMAGHKAKFISDILYVYNLGNPLNDHKIDNAFQLKLEKQIRAKERYPRILNNSASDLMRANRFDIAAKTLYARNFLKGTGSRFAKDLYLQHLKVWNNFQEQKPIKTKSEDFTNSFQSLLNSIRTNGFDESQGKIPVINGTLINGAHRAASCIVLEKKLDTYEADISEGQFLCDYQYFKNKTDFAPEGLEQKFLDEMAIEFCKNKNNLYTISLFPSHDEPVGNLLSIIKQGYNIIYDKEVALAQSGKINYIHNLYYKENWIGTKSNNYPGVLEKSKYCFSKGNTLRVVLVEENNVDNLLYLKDKLRSVCNVGKHSVHINDTQEETWRIATSVFNDNSIDLLNKRKFSETPNFDRYFSNYAEIIKHRSDNEDFCIDSSAVLSAYGLRDCRDLDFLHLNNLRGIAQDIDCHNPESHHYRVDKNEIIYNPALHFYLHGIKFASLSTVKEMKLFRAEEKDLFDCELIEDFDMEYNEIFGWFSSHHKKVYRNVLSQVEPGDHILEVGCLLGKSTLYLANLIKDKNVVLHCCDLWEAETASSLPVYCKEFEKQWGKDLYPEFKKNLFDFEFIKAYKMSSTEFFCNLTDDFKFKRIYLDGCHDYEVVKLDIINSLKYIKDDGIIAGDDYEEGVAEAVDEIFGNAIEFSSPRQWIFDVKKNTSLYSYLLQKYH
tara:strand:+ start:17 stop:2599 length:2583 start_codon:yes stop_codon:yes gene_type:complete